MRYGFIAVTQKPSNSSPNGTAPSLSHPNIVRQYTIEHMHYVTHSVNVGWCMDCKNMQGMNTTKNARQGSLNVNSMLMLLSDIHGVCVMNFLTKNCEPLLLNLWNSWIGFSTTKMHQLFVTLCVNFWPYIYIYIEDSHSTPSLITRFSAMWILLS